ncbi:MAG TPA: hypothetical protein VK970_17160, partial [Candidatus Methylacidiphilales bacterium]|nr:hypothetical protein [Candidatus Methylacidiphilales bacterium]
VRSSPSTAYWHVCRNGYCAIDDEGSTEWHFGDQRNHGYLVQTMPPAEIASILEVLMCAEPRLV